MKTTLWLFAPLMGIVAISACTSVAESFSSVEVSDSAGVRIVHSRGPRWTDGEAWWVSTEPKQSIGVLNGPEEYQFVEVSAAARRSDGKLVVVDRGSQTVRLYDREGTFIRTLGGPGSGPGEFQDPGQLLVTAGDSVVVWDNALFRITRFDPEGGLAGVQAVDLGTIAKAIEAPLYPGAMEPLLDGSLLVRLVEKSGKDTPFGLFRQRSGALRVSEDLSVIDTLMFFGDLEQISVDAPWGQTAVAPPHAKKTWITHQGSPSRICIGDQEGPEIVCFGPDGNRTLLRWSSDPTPPTREEIAEWREASIRLYELKLGEDDILGMLDQLPIPAVRPDYSQITLDRLGNLWVELGPTTGATAPSVDHLVFDPAGALLGIVPLPPIQVLEIGDDYVLGVQHDELEVEYLQVYEIEKQSTADGEGPMGTLTFPRDTMLSYVRIYADAEGESHFEDVEVDLNLIEVAPGISPLFASSFAQASRYAFLSAKPGWREDWHPAPQRQFLVYLAGVTEFQVSDGEIRRLGPGTILLAEDTLGKGHISEVVGEADVIAVLIQLEREG